VPHGITFLTKTKQNGKLSLQLARALSSMELANTDSKLLRIAKLSKPKYTPKVHSANATPPTATPITNTRKVNMTDLKTVPTVNKIRDALESYSHIHSAPAQENSTNTNYPTKDFLVNLAKSRLPPSDI
jgi:hypothetical protein